MSQNESRINMDRLSRLAEFWNWLPAYRAVAETEHVRTAAERLHVSPSALSRSIGLLEESLGEKLFDREGRGIRLNRTGREFLRNLRAAMRLVDEGLQAVESATFAGPVHIAVPDDLVRLLLPGLRALGGEHPDLEVHMRAVAPRLITEHLVRGVLDIGFMQGPVPETDLKVHQFTEASNGVYCGHDNPLFGRTEIELDEVLEYPFVGGKEADGSPTDNWPPDVPRHVRLSVNRLQAAVDACAFGGFLAALPDHVAAPRRERELLWRLPVDVVPDTTFYMIQRPKLVERDRNDMIGDFLKSYVAD
jgi:DNA-binding transcriptional LysR family regulator